MTASYHVAGSILLVSLPIVSCAADVCEDARKPQIVIVSIDPVQDVYKQGTPTVTVKARVDHPGDLAVQKVRILDRRASTGDGLEWTVSVPFEALENKALQSVDSGQGPITEPIPVEIDATAMHACGEPAKADPITIYVQPRLRSEVEAITLGLQYPPEADWLPTNGQESALVEISADIEAIGGQVLLRADRGAIVDGGSLVGEKTLALAETDSDGGRRAGAFVWVRPPDGAQALHLLAEAVDGPAWDQLDLRLEGPATLAPAGAAGVPAGTTITVHVDAAPDQELRCRATLAPWSDQLMAVVRDPDGVESDLLWTWVPLVPEAVLVASAPADLDAALTLTISCMDAYDQLSTGSYSFAAAP